MTDKNRNWLLQWKGNQLQMKKKLPRDITAAAGKGWYVVNLKTSDVIKAGKLRDRELIKLEDWIEKVRQVAAASGKDDEALAEAYLETPDEDREALEDYLQDKAEMRGDDDEGVA